MLPAGGYCTLCRQDLPASSFAPSALRKSRRAWCKPCSAAAVKRRRRERGLYAPKLHTVCQRDGCEHDISHKRADAKWCSAACASAAWHDAYPGGRRAWRIQYAYGLTVEQFDELLAAQGGRCAICRTTNPPGEGRKAVWNVDHCHKSGAVRGVLCAACNSGLGYMRDDPEVLRAAISYLGQYGQLADTP